MKTRRFSPTLYDVLEDRVALTAFAIPFTIVSNQTTPVNPKFLNLTGRTENQINGAITKAFNNFSHDLFAAANAYNKGAAKPGADTSALLAAFNASEAKAFSKLSSALTSVSFKVPYGNQNLNATLQARIEGSAGVTDTTTKVNTPSLQTRLSTLATSGTNAQIQSAINATEALVSSDVKDYVNLGVTNQDFKLTRGATFPALS